MFLLSLRLFPTAWTINGVSTKTFVWVESLAKDSVAYEIEQARSDLVLKSELSRIEQSLNQVSSSSVSESDIINIVDNRVSRNSGSVASADSSGAVAIAAICLSVVALIGTVTMFINKNRKETRLQGEQAV